MILLLDIGNTHVHAGLATTGRVARRMQMPTAWLARPSGRWHLGRFVKGSGVESGALCSVVPRATPLAQGLVKGLCGVRCGVLSAKTVRGVEVDYPRPWTIGADRLANAIAVHLLFGAPALAIDFGTAATFDVVDGRGRFVGGVIAPGLELMASYLHEKTALLPAIRIRKIPRVIGKSTEEAMLVGAVHGYTGLVRALVGELRGALHSSPLPVVATGGYARLIAGRVPEITAVRPGLTLEGLRLWWNLCRSEGGP